MCVIIIISDPETIIVYGRYETFHIRSYRVNDVKKCLNICF